MIRNILELNRAKRLKNLGFIQDSTYFWVEDLDNKATMYVAKTKEEIGKNEEGNYILYSLLADNKAFAAPIAEELGIHLPEQLFDPHGIKMLLRIGRSKGEWFTMYGIGHGGQVIEHHNKILVNSMADTYEFFLRHVKGNEGKEKEEKK